MGPCSLSYGAETGMKIGLLDDNPIVLEYMTIALKLAGHTVSAFGYAAPLLATLSAAGALPYDLLIVDLLLSGGESGLAVLAQVEQDLSFARLPVIIVSAGSVEELEYVKKRFPQVPVLRKPFQLHVLLQAVEHFSSLGVSQGG